MSALTTSETLNLAADLIEERGWEGGEWPQHDYTNGPLCLEGGIMAALDLRWPALAADEEQWDRDLQACPAFAAVKDYLGLRPYVYNDRTGRTQAEVIAVLRATAVIESAREVRTTLAGLPGSPA